ncbi:MAG TPA: hypothetical protein VFA00_01080 [Actinomycetota bacterium]|nr:hypothetical protein [Actinomycetota bacterium]
MFEANVQVNKPKAKQNLRRRTMKVTIENGNVIGTAEWKSPGEVDVDVADPEQREWFEDYFSTEDAWLSGPVESAEMTSDRRDSSPEAFAHAAFMLAAYAYKVSGPYDGSS